MNALQIILLVVGVVFALGALICIPLAILHLCCSHTQPRFIAKNGKKTYSFGFISEGLGFIAIFLAMALIGGLCLTYVFI